MCSGGGSSATITMPDYSAYNNEFQLQKSAIEQTMNNSTQMLQQQLTASLRDKQTAYGQLTDQARLQAENTNAQAMRLTTLIGAPPPEKSAEAPRVGATARGIATTKGKSALRITRESAAASNSGGSGLNITTTPV